MTDKNGNAIPWCTYPYIFFVEPRLKKEFKVFEFGCGASSEWYAQRCGSVTSVENDKEWYEIVKKKTDKYGNVEILYRENVEDFLEAIFIKGEKYDFIIVDCALKDEPKSREKAMQKAVSACSEEGIIVLDDSERFPIMVNDMMQNGFKKIDFYGLSPSNSYFGGCTTIFYRENNILDI